MFFFYLIYFIQLLLPFVCLISLPDMKNAIVIKIEQWKRRNVIGDGTHTKNDTTLATVHH